MTEVIYTDFILDYHTMKVTIGKEPNKKYKLQASVKNCKDKINKSKWNIWTHGDPLDKWCPVIKNYHSKWSVPILKSNLQKAIRRMDIQEAQQSTLELAIIDPKALLRRLPIIAVEDVTLIQGTSVIIMLMMMNKTYFYTKEIVFILKYVNALSCLESTFYNDRQLKPNSLNFDSFIKQPELAALFIRVAYGGMASDLIMLQRAIIVFSKMSILDAMDLVENVILPDTINFKHTVLTASLDFHPNPWILNFIARKTKISKERIKELIWDGESALNTRKPYTYEISALIKKENDWKVILPHLIITYKLVYKNNNLVYSQ